MQEKKITRMVEEVIRTEYVAEDGTVFSDEKECRKYEESALFAVKRELKQLYDGYEEDFFCRGCDDPVEVFDIQTEKDLEYLRRYIYLVAKQNGAPEKCIKNSIDQSEITAGHEVIICWYYDMDDFYTYGDGSIDAFLAAMKEHMTKAITPKTKKE